MKRYKFCVLTKREEVVAGFVRTESEEKAKEIIKNHIENVSNISVREFEQGEDGYCEIYYGGY